MLLALTSKELALGAVAAVFIVFALLASFVLPRRNPDFPGERLPLFVGVTVLLFVAMMGSVYAFAGAEETGGGHEVEGAEPEVTVTTGGSGGGGGGEAAGDPAAGEGIFVSAGCVACHVLEDAGSTGTVGPNLDESKPSFELAVDRVTNGAGSMPPFEGQLTEQQIRDVAAYVVQATS